MIWEKFIYKHNDNSEIVAAAIYTYKGERGKDKRYVYKLPEIESEILIYNFKTIDVEKIELEKIISPLFKQKIINEIENQQLSNLRDWLLPMLMNGQVKVSDSAKEPKAYTMNSELIIAAEP